MFTEFCLSFSFFFFGFQPVVQVFSDLCVRFASLTDPYISQYSNYLSDVSSVMIRKQSLTLLAGLVAQDYIKCKGLIVFKYIIIFYVHDTSAFSIKNCLIIVVTFYVSFLLFCNNNRLLTCLSDMHQSVRNLAEAVVLNVLLPRQVRRIEYYRARLKDEYVTRCSYMKASKASYWRCLL